MAVPVGITNCGEAKILPYEAALHAAGVEPVRLTPGSPQSLDGLHGLVLTGGRDINPRRYGQVPVPETQDPDDARDDMEMCLLGEALAIDLPVFAICRGMQLLNVHLHGTLHQHLSSLPIHRQVFPDDPPGQHRAIHDVDVKPGTILASITGAVRLPVNSRHHQAVASLGAGVIATAASDDGITEAIEYPARRWVVGVQWHPEDRIEVSRADRALFEAFAREVAR